MYKKKIIYVFSAIIALAIYLFFSLFGGGGAISSTAVFAEEGYSAVLDDLYEDENFNVNDYPQISDDYSLQIISLAESTENELFLYVYQPSGQAKNLVASSVNISTTKHDDISPLNYKLELLNSDGVFYKYIVLGLTVSVVSPRYYCITSIYRPFDSTIDTGADYGNTVAEVPYSVSRQYTFTTDGMSVVDIETIKITSKYVGLVRYSEGFTFSTSVGACDNHFVAFDTDKPIDKLYEADVYYTQQSYYKTLVPFYGESETFGEKSDEYAYLKYTDDTVEYQGAGFFAPVYKWDTIETIEQFIEETNSMQNVYSGALFDIQVATKITDEGIAALQDKKWVLRFAVTDYSVYAYVDGGSSYSSTIVGEVSILRLKFETDGVTYNLGVIDNKQSGSGEPINEESIGVSPTEKTLFDKLCEFLESITGIPATVWKLLLSTLPILILLILFFPIISPILSVIVKLVLWIISAPFKLIAKLFKKKE